MLVFFGLFLFFFYSFFLWLVKFWRDEISSSSWSTGCISALDIVNLLREKKQFSNVFICYSHTQTHLFHFHNDCIPNKNENKSKWKWKGRCMLAFLYLKSNKMDRMIYQEKKEKKNEAGTILIYKDKYASKDQIIFRKISN